MKHAQSRGSELLEMMTDCPREVLLNSHTAQHMRAFGRGRDELFWARCEWDRTDIAFGKAERRFDARNWNDEWGKKTTGDLGIIEAKLIYHHMNVAELYIQEMARQLRHAEMRCGRPVGLKLGMVWWVSYENGDSNEYLPGLMTNHGFAPVGPGYSKIAEGDTRTMWPIEPGGIARLDVGLFRLNGVKVT